MGISIYHTEMSAPQKIHTSEKALNPTANDVLNFAEKLSGEDTEAGAPSLGLLQLIVMIRKAEAGNAGNDAWTPLVENQLRHMKAAVRLCNESPLIALRFGNTLEGALKLVGILKARASELEMSDTIDKVVKDEISDHMPSRAIQASSSFKTKSTLRYPASASSLSASSGSP